MSNVDYFQEAVDALEEGDIQDSFACIAEHLKGKIGHELSKDEENFLACLFAYEMIEEFEGKLDFEKFADKIEVVMEE